MTAEPITRSEARLDNQSYTDDEREQAVAVFQQVGSYSHAARMLREMWGPSGRRIPSPEAIGLWVRRGDIVPSEELTMMLRDYLRAKTYGMVDELGSKFHERIMRRVDDDNVSSLELHNDVKSLTFLSNLAMPANGSGYGQHSPSITFNDNRKIVMPFTAAPPQLVEGEVVGDAEPVQR